MSKYSYEQSKWPHSSDLANYSSTSAYGHTSVLRLPKGWFMLQVSLNFRDCSVSDPSFLLQPRFLFWELLVLNARVLTSYLAVTPRPPCRLHRTKSTDSHTLSSVLYRQRRVLADATVTAASRRTPWTAGRSRCPTLRHTQHALVYQSPRCCHT